MKQFSGTSVFQRMPSLDAVRGFALFGILFANIPLSHEYDQLYNTRALVAGSRQTDTILNILFEILVERKFVTIFSILFGVGFYIQIQRAAVTKQQFQSYFCSRMLVLLIIGCLHAYLLWNGDILRNYALCGLFLLLIYKWKANKIVTAAVLLCVVLSSVTYILYGIFNWDAYTFDTSIIKEHPAAATYFRYFYINFRIDSFINFIQATPLTMIFCSGCMLLGVWLGKTGFFHKPEMFAARRRGFIVIGFVFGMSCSYAFYQLKNGAIELTPALLWLPFVLVSGIILQSLAYISLFIELRQQAVCKKVMALFEPVGRMSLSNYILQSVLYTILFFHWPHLFQLYGKLTLTETFLICGLIFGFQVFLSRLWLLKYPQGPLEYIWGRMVKVLSGTKFFLRSC